MQAIAAKLEPKKWKIDTKHSGMVKMSKYSLTYEDGKCPLGYEYVSGYMTMEGKWVDAHCRKLRRLKKPHPAEESEHRKFFL